MQPDHLESKVAALEEENDLLREEIARLQAALSGAVLSFPVEWGLTVAEQRVLGVIASRPLATKDAIMAAVYRDAGRDEANLKIVDVFVCKIRKKLRPHGIEIETVWGQGYRLGEAAKAAIKAVAA